MSEVPLYARLDGPRLEQQLASCAVHSSNCFTQMCSGYEEGSYMRLIDAISLNSRLKSNKEEKVTKKARFERGPIETAVGKSC